MAKKKKNFHELLHLIFITFVNLGNAVLSFIKVEDFDAEIIQESCSRSHS